MANKAAHKWENWPSRTLDGKTVGILGVGVIAEAMAPRFKAFGMTVIGISSGPRPLPGFDRMEDREKLLSVVPELDYFVVLTPYSPATRHIINAAVLGAMKPSAYLINLARGGVLDEAALLDTMKAGTIAGASLDVYAREPLPPEHPFWELDNMILTCHQAATNENSAQNNLPIINENIRRFIAGDIAGMKNIVKRIGEPPHDPPVAGERQGPLPDHRSEQLGDRARHEVGYDRPLRRHAHEGDPRPSGRARLPAQAERPGSRRQELPGKGAPLAPVEIGRCRSTLW